MTLMTYTTKPCQVCGDRSILSLDADKVQEWQRGKHVQDVFPRMTADERELLITGTHAACWDIMFPPDDDDDEDEFLSGEDDLDDFEDDA